MDMVTYFLIAGVFIIIGLSMILSFFLNLIKVKKSRSWVAIKGEIVSSGIDTLSITNEIIETYKAKITYKYSISGKQYISNRVFFGDRIYSSIKGNSKKLFEKYPAGIKVDVYYNPLKMEESVLEREVATNVIALLIMGILFILSSTLLMVYYSNLMKILSINN
jgi:hypothetical protein